MRIVCKYLACAHYNHTQVRDLLLSHIASETLVSGVGFIFLEDSGAAGSENTAERFLAVLASEWLTTIGKLTLTPAQMELVALAYSSEDRVSVCSGCTYWEQLPLREALHQDSYIRLNADYWFEDKFSRHKRK